MAELSPNLHQPAPTTTAVDRHPSTFRLAQPPKDTTDPSSPLPRYKDQVRPGGRGRGDVLPPRSSLVPFAAATPVTDSQILQEERRRLEEENMDLLQRNWDLEQRHWELQEQQHQHQLGSTVDAQPPSLIAITATPTDNPPSVVVANDVGVPVEQQPRNDLELDQLGPKPPIVPLLGASSTPSSTKKLWMGIAIIVLFLALALVVGICASGNCDRSSESQNNNQPTLSSTSKPITTAAPTLTRTPIVASTTTTTSPTLPLTSHPVRETMPTLRPVPLELPTLRPLQPTMPPPISVVTPVARTAPTTSSPRAESILTFINSITLTGQTLAYPSNATAEERAIQWLIDDDLNNSTTLRAFRQRYVLATVWFQNGPVINTLGTWLSSRTECEWRYTVCVNGDVTTVWLGAGDTGLNGPIPSEVGLLTSLTWLDLSGDLAKNGLTGNIPSSLGLLTRLTTLRLNTNQLTGTIPSSFGSLIALRELTLSNNQLTGTIPSSLGSLAALTSLSLYNNQLISSVPYCDSNVSSSGFTILDADCNEVDCHCCTQCCPSGGWDGIPSLLNGCDA